MTWRTLFQGGHKKDINAMCYSPNGDIIISGSEDKSLVIWSVEEGIEIDRLYGHKDAILCLDINKEGKIISGGKDKNIIIWDSLTQQQFH